jgi:hypothetical protein
MTAESDAFEQLNERISRLVQGQGAQVEWNAAIPDPDSPNDLRQIDVLITTADARKLSVECRDRAAVQTVMWIEELAGRKLSLGLDGMIAVAVNGFSELAQKKAKRFGIELYDFKSLTDEEIASWIGAAEVEAIFMQVDKLEILAGIPEARAAGLLQNPNFKLRDQDGYAAIMDLIRDDVAASPGIHREQTVDSAEFTVDDVPLTVLRCQYSGRLVTAKATCTAVSTFGMPGVPAPLRDIAVQKFNHSVPELIQKQNEAHLLVDVSKLPVPPDSILHEIRISFKKKMTLTRYELVGMRSMHTRSTKIALIVATTA